MGSNWSESAKEESKKNRHPVPKRKRPAAEISTEESNSGGGGGGVGENHDDDDSSTPTGGSVLSRKRRRLDQKGTSFMDNFETKSTAVGSTNIWNRFADSLSFGFAKAFLIAAELAAKSAKPGELEENDFIQGIVQSLDYFPNDIGMLRRGWRILCACSVECDPRTVPMLFQQEPSLESDLTMVVTAMQRHGQRNNVQLLGFRAIRIIIAATENDDRLDYLLDTNAISVFIQAMRNHSNDVVIQRLGISFLAMLVRDVDPRPSQQIFSLGGIQLIMAAMRNFQDDARLIYIGLFALIQLGFHARMKEMVLALGGIDLFLEALKNHIDNCDLVQLCLTVLNVFSDFDWPIISPLILHAGERWPKKPNIQKQLLVLLFPGIRRMPTTLLTRSHRRAILLTVHAMKNFPNTYGIQYSACAVLKEFLERITTVQDVRDCILEEGGMECVVQALLHHRVHSQLQPLGLLALLNVVRRCTPMEAAAIDAFGGNVHALALIAGVRVELVHQNEG